MEKPDFWSNQKKAKKISRKLNSLKNTVKESNRIQTIKDDLETYKLLLEDEFNQNLFEEAVKKLNKYEKQIEKAEIKFLLDEENDSDDAILTIHPGAGGTESQDWAEMLLRMYKRWASNSGYELKLVDYQPGDEAGVKSVTMEILGDYAYGYLKAEIGIHRLVRISPFNAQGKRQTSFASVFVYPLVDDDIDIDIDEKDLRIDTYRSSGKGGQSVNTKDSAVRITHIPTSIIVQCQNERSQIKNREIAMKILKSRLYQHYKEQKNKEKEKLENSKTDIGWGNQIRSYVFHPYQMVKDHRTDYKTGNVDAVMDGDLDKFINTYLRYRKRKN